MSSHFDGSPLLKMIAEHEVAQYREPLVLGAVPIKSELLVGEQNSRGYGEVFEIVARQWRGVIQAVRTAERLVVVGYGFPVEDDYGRFLFTEAARLRAELVAIDCYETAVGWRTTKTSLKQVFAGKIMGLDHKGEVKPPGFRLRAPRRNR
jgi:hypothetical protein